MSKQPPFLMIPGPTPLPDAVREALARPAIGHRSPEFKTILESVFPKLRRAFRTQSDVFLYTASGTGAMEAALVNTLNPGDKIVVLVCGVFSQRWAEIAKTLGIDADTLTVPAGEINTVEALKGYLAENKVRAVLMTHSETSTGVLNPVRELAAVAKEHGALSIVDAVTSLGAAPFETDAWGIDLAVSGSQKGFMLPPGLSFLSVGERAWEAHKACKNPGYYFNFTRYKKAQDEFTTPYTPSTPLIIGLEIALNMMEAEGLDAIWSRHATLQSMTRAGVEALGLKPVVADLAQASTAVTSVYPPDGYSVADIRKGVKDRGFLIADGQKELKGKIFRIGHLGYVNAQNVRDVLTALEETLKELGYPIPKSGCAAEAALACSGS